MHLETSTDSGRHKLDKDTTIGIAIPKLYASEYFSFIIGNTILLKSNHSRRKKHGLLYFFYTYFLK